METLSSDLVEEILSRLPVRQLLRSRCVRKSWCALIDSYSFIKKQHEVQYAMAKEGGDVPFFVDHPSGNMLDPVEFYLLSKKRQVDGGSCLTPDLSRDCAPYFTSEFNTLVCVGVVNGVVGLWWWGDNAFGLWNPATREFKAILPPQPRRPSNARGFDCGTLRLGFDSKSNDFKILGSMFRRVSKENDDVESIHVYHLYSLTTNSWKSLEEPLPNLRVNYSSTDGFFNGVYYWTAFVKGRGTHPARRYMILSFDFSAEAFKLLDPPPVVVTSREDNWDWMVRQYIEQLAVIFSRENTEKQVYNFEIWVVDKTNDEDSGMPLSWQHLFTIGPFPAFLRVQPKAFRMDGQLLVKICTKENEEFDGSDEDYEGSNGECGIYNPSTRSFTMSGLSFSSCYKYVESLFPLSKRPKIGLL